MKRIALLGSTGSIGRQTLEVVETMGYTITALTANRSVELLEAQCRKFRPRLAVCMDPEAAETLKIKLADTCVEVRSGMDGLLAAAGDEDTDVVLTAVMGMVGLRPTLAALKKGRRVALANKETLVCAGELVMETARRYGGEILPVDSEHSAIFQCLQGAFLWKDKAGTGGGHASGCAEAPQLVHGSENHGGFGHHDEQGVGNH